VTASALTFALAVNGHKRVDAHREPPIRASRESVPVWAANDRFRGRIQPVDATH
jgi:hypothetical protein